jgi:hypothetical protein
MAGDTIAGLRKEEIEAELDSVRKRWSFMKR